MPEIQAFRALRYDLGHVGSLSEVVAPPYDVIDAKLQEDLYQRHPCNVVRLILNRIEPGDDESNNRYTRAKRFLKNWQSEGVLFTEADPAVYVYHQQFEFAGREYTRRGFMVRARLSRFGEGLVFPHEETMPGPKIDRLMLTAVCKANLSQIFGLYPDPDCEAQTLLEEAIGDAAPVEAVDHLGVVHRLWPVTDVSVVSAVAAAMGPKPIFIADGHHRYETACEYRDQVREGGVLDPEHPSNFVLMMCVAMEDPGLAVLPTHRLLTGVPELSAEELAGRLGDSFVCEPAGEGPEAAHALWQQIEAEGAQGTLALFTRKDNRWTLLRLTEAGRGRMADAAQDHAPQWQGLGVSLLHRLILQTLLGIEELPKPGYVHLVDEVVQGLASGEYPMAALVMPATVDHIRALSMQGERMPAKSTYFYPKLLSGLVINPLE
jgi:uncharacterized protein (DUF1015 family)